MTTPTEREREAAREAVFSFTYSSPVTMLGCHDDIPGWIEIVASALAQARREQMERDCAIAENEMTYPSDVDEPDDKDFFETYNQAVDDVVRAIRAAAIEALRGSGESVE